MEPEETPDQKAERLVAEFGQYDPQLDLASYHFPELDLLDTDNETYQITADELNNDKQVIVDTLYYAHMEITGIEATIGPRAILYEITPGRGVRIAQIVQMEDDIALRLGKKAKVTGAILSKGSIGIEVPHQERMTLSMSTVLANAAYQHTSMELPIVMGMKGDGELLLVDLVKLPHLLIAGATGQGKSVAINAILTGLLYKKHPAELKLVLIDVNSLELGPFWRMERHFLAKIVDAPDAIIKDIPTAVNTLNSIGIELDQRYALFQAARVKNLTEYNHKFINRKIDEPEKHRYLPFMVVVIDEFADLIASDLSVEAIITKLAQLGRPAGIHLIFSTQRPSVRILTGNIKANFMSRLAFKTATSTDSRTIIDQGGAEKLEGDGDMLFYNGNETIRLQGAFISTDEIEKIGEFIRLQRGYPSAFYLPEYETYRQPEIDLDQLDPYFEEAARLVVMHQQGSTSLIQRKLKLGYNRTGRIIDQLEAMGIVGPFAGSKAREVLYPDEYSLMVYLESLQTEVKPEAVKEQLLPFVNPSPKVSQTPPVQSPIQQPQPVKKKTFLERLLGI